MTCTRNVSNAFVLPHIVQQESDTSQNKLQQIQSLQQLETYLVRTSAVEVNVLLCAKNFGPHT